MSSTDPMFDPSDLEEPDYYCRHGRFIGNPYGADYMCFYCEMGYSDEEYAEEIRAIRLRKMITDLKHEVVKRVFEFGLWESVQARATDEQMKDWFGEIVNEIDSLSHDEALELMVNHMGWVRS